MKPLVSYIPRYFRLQELVPRIIYEDYTHRNLIHRLWWKFNPRGLWTIDRLRDKYGPMICNTWHDGGAHQYRGYRPPDCPVGSSDSDHKVWGNAFDLVPVNEEVERIRQDILDNPWVEDFAYITVLELDIPWLHVAFRNWDKGLKGILTFTP